MPKTHPTPSAKANPASKSGATVPKPASATPAKKATASKAMAPGHEKGKVEPVLANILAKPKRNTKGTYSHAPGFLHEHPRTIVEQEPASHTPPLNTGTNGAKKTTKPDGTRHPNGLVGHGA